jgi:hypothetical protein
MLDAHRGRRQALVNPAAPLLFFLAETLVMAGKMAI